ncbi:hypothetical protein [Adhaeribacter aquaticus]|uniref:hypothetical protein n=1 Tax=Adhaeribacter aquaticus TaxID=299567 RepID=UPI0004219F5D|nr:hypothetical protein [Adhaeribacter aquaticus]
MEWLIAEIFLENKIIAEKVATTPMAFNINDIAAFRPGIEDESEYTYLYLKSGDSFLINLPFQKVLETLKTQKLDYLYN